MDMMDDKELVLVAMVNDGLALEYVSDDLRNDKEVVLAAVKCQSNALKYASYELRGDKEVVIAAIRKFHAAIKHALPPASEDPEVLAEYRQAVLRYVSQEYRKGLGLSNLSDEILKDREIVLTAVRNGWRLDGVYDRVIMDEEIAGEIFSRFYGREDYLPSQEVHAELMDIVRMVQNYNAHRNDEDLERPWLESDEHMLELVSFFVANILVLAEDTEILHDSLRLMEDLIFGNAQYARLVQHYDDWQSIYNDIKKALDEYHILEDYRHLWDEQERFEAYAIGWCQNLSALEYEGPYNDNFRGIRVLLKFAPESIAMPVMLSKCYQQ